MLSNAAWFLAPSLFLNSSSSSYYSLLTDAEDDSYKNHGTPKSPTSPSSNIYHHQIHHVPQKSSSKNRYKNEICSRTNTTTMPENSDVSLVYNETQFDKSMQELRKLSSQLYNAADYCENTFLKAEDKRNVVETTKEYISNAVVTVVDHLGSISSNLESCLSDDNSIPQTEHKLDILKLRIGICQHYSHKLAVAKLYGNSDSSRRHRRYILPPLTDSSTKINVAANDRTKGGIDAEIIEKEDEFETEEPLFLHTYNCKPSLIDKFSINDIDKRNGFSPQVVPVRDGLSILPKPEQSTFQFQETRKLKRSIINWKLMQNKDIASLIRRGKRIIA